MIVNPFLKVLIIIFLHIIFLFLKYLDFSLPFLMAFSTITNFLCFKFFIDENKDEKHIKYVGCFLFTFISFFCVNFFFNKLHLIIILIMIFCFFKVNPLMLLVFVSYPCDFYILLLLTCNSFLFIMYGIVLAIKFFIQLFLKLIESILEKIFFMINLKSNKKKSSLKNLKLVNSINELIDLIIIFLLIITKIVYFCFCISIENKYEGLKTEKGMEKQLFLSNITILNPIKTPYISCLKKMKQIEMQIHKKNNRLHVGRSFQKDQNFYFWSQLFYSIIKYIFKK